MMRAIGITLLLTVATSPTLAHSPGADLDKLMGSREKYFQPKSPSGDFMKDYRVFGA